VGPNVCRIGPQPDCDAGSCACDADTGEGARLEPIAREQVPAAVETARAVGDDNIQERSSREVRPDTITHGTSEQRQEAFLAGYREGTMATCDYLERGVYTS